MPKSSMLMLMPISLMTLSRVTACSTSSISRPSVTSKSNLPGLTPHFSMESATLRQKSSSLNCTTLMLMEILTSWPCAGPLRELPAGFVNDPLAHGNDLPALFEELNEAVRRYHFAVVPPSQDLPRRR